jgi:acyl-CoA reductase-like NAD-dependent aldehyde dehydrogenase
MDLSQPNISASTLRDQFTRSRAAYDHHRMPTADSRRATLKKLEVLLRDNAAAIEQAISTDFGHRSAHETRMLELFPAFGALHDAYRHVGSWMKPQYSWASLWFLPARNEIRPQPLGVVGIIVPWNYPILLAVAPLAGALAAGNRVLIKMSEFTPKTGELFAHLIGNAFPADQISVVNGGADIAQEFSALPFDHLLFTGSTAVGKQVMRAAAANLTPVTLELGGKSPAIVGPECNIQEAANKILFGKCLNAGQTCIAPDYVLLPCDQVENFVAAAKIAASTLYPSLAANPDYTSIVNDRHRQRLAGYIEDARRKGAVVEDLHADNALLGAGGKMGPVVVTRVNDDMQVMQDEIFGPVLPLVPYDSLDDAIRYVNERPHPLALYYFGRDSSNIDRVLNETIAGGMSVNETIMHISQDDLPFGGVGPSGMGAYHGRAGFETFSRMKPVFHQAKLNGLALFKPPFGKRFDTLIKLLLR